jgi:hypothetical protein
MPELLLKKRVALKIQNEIALGGAFWNLTPFSGRFKRIPSRAWQWTSSYWRK